MMLLMGALYPTVVGWGFGVASAVSTQRPGYGKIARILLLIQYSNWALILWSMAIMFFYYGLKYTFILRANIIIAETALKAPRAAFGIKNLKSSSPARFLFIQLQITGFGGAAVTILAGTLCTIWVLFRQRILEMKDDWLPHTIAFFWTCAMAVAFFVIMALVTVQSVRTRRRSCNEPEASFSTSGHPSSGQKSSQKSTVFAKGLYSSTNHNSYNQKSRSVDSESGLAQRNSTEMSTLNSVQSFDKGLNEEHSLEFPQGHLHDQHQHAHWIENDAFSAAHHQNKMEQERLQRSSGGSSGPKRQFTMSVPGLAHSFIEPTSPLDKYSTRRGSDTSSSGHIRSAGSDLRMSVFGRMPAARPSSPPPPSVPVSPSLPSFPKKAARLGGWGKQQRQSQQQQSDQRGRHSTSSHTGSPTSSQTQSREHRSSLIPEGFAVAKDDQGGDLLYSNAIQQQYHYPHEPYQLPSNGLSPPPRRTMRHGKAPSSSSLQPQDDTALSAMGTPAILIEKALTSVDQMTVQTVADPILKKGEVLIDVKAAGLNFFDILQVQEKYQVKPPYPYIPGAEFAGVVTAVGPDAKSMYKVGDRVFGSTQGCYAEKVCCNPKTLLPIPANLSFEQAAGLFITYPTSYVALAVRAQLKAGEWCLVHAAAGGVGIVAVQIARALGAKVIATAGSQEKLAIALANGADHAVNYRDKDWAAQVLKITGGKGVDVIYDPVGLINDSLRCAAWCARVLVVGFAAGTIEKIPANRILLKNISVVGVHWGAYAKFDPATMVQVWKELLQLFAEEKLVPVIYEKVYRGLDSVKIGLTDLATRKTWGKAVVAIQGVAPTSSKL
ncbi:hypothetical protein BGZ94_007672 [Podila epigama]|nr:hypothetical protein BGZ94_007672 [Podila epigama]